MGCGVAERWFLSDTHFGHENIIKYCSRPFKDAQEMDEMLILNWNKVVQPQDHVSHLGDVTMMRNGGQKGTFIKLMKRLNGHKRLYLGNHDHFPIQTYLEVGFEKIYATWRDEKGVLFSHFPIHPENLGSAKANVHGHIHQNESPKPMIGVSQETEKVYIKPYINISVEVIDYKPVNYDTILKMIKDKINEVDNS